MLSRSMGLATVPIVWNYFGKGKCLHKDPSLPPLHLLPRFPLITHLRQTKGQGQAESYLLSPQKVNYHYSIRVSTLDPSIVLFPIVLICTAVTVLCFKVRTHKD